MSTVLITGAAVRIGRSIALHLAEAGYKIAVHYNHSREQAAQLCLEIEEQGGKSQPFQADLATDEGVFSLIANVADTFSDLNVLVNNASVFERAPYIETSPELFDRALNVNLKAPYFLIQRFARNCGKGNVVNILDTKVAADQPNYSAYVLGKKGLAELTRLAALELAPDFCVNGVSPGVVLPPSDQNEEDIEPLVKRVPLRRKGTPQEIAESVQFLVESGFITGEILNVDGGEHLRG